MRFSGPCCFRLVEVRARLDLLKVLLDAHGNHFSESHRNSIADESPDRLKFHRFTLWSKLIALRKSLEQSCFTQANCSILLRMTKSSVAETVAERGHGWSGLVPSHPPINRTEALAGVATVAFRHQFFVPVLPRSARLRLTNPLKVEVAHSRRYVKRIVPVGSPSVNVGQVANRI